MNELETVLEYLPVVRYDIRKSISSTKPINW